VSQTATEVLLLGIPLAGGNRPSLGMISIEVAQAHPSVYELVRNKRQNIVRVLQKARVLPVTRFSAAGRAYEQKLPSGHVVWALKGRTAEDCAIDTQVA
jgi:hypothetical protein